MADPKNTDRERGDPPVITRVQEQEGSFLDCHPPGYADGPLVVNGEDNDAAVRWYDALPDGPDEDDPAADAADLE